MCNEELYHHGIKGMRWGVRRSEEQLARVRGKKKTDPVKEHNDKLTKAPIHKMSNSELKELNERLRLEEEYRRLVNNRTSVSKGKKLVDRTSDTMLKLISADLAKSGAKYVMTAAGMAASYAIKKAMDSDAAKRAAANAGEALIEWKSKR